jgi:hypothetical protein
MLCDTNDLKDFAIQGLDGEIGHDTDLYFDVDTWVIRYFVVETRTFSMPEQWLLIECGARQGSCRLIYAANG